MMLLSIFGTSTRLSRNFSDPASLERVHELASKTTFAREHSVVEAVAADDSVDLAALILVVWTSDLSGSRETMLVIIIILEAIWYLSSFTLSHIRVLEKDVDLTSWLILPQAHNAEFQVITL